MSNLPIRSPMQINVRPGGQVDVSLNGQSVTGPINVVPETGPARDWLAELGLPKDWAQLEAMAQATRLSPRKFSCIAVDESPTRFPGNWRFRPREIRHGYTGYYLTFGHLPLVIGHCDPVLKWPAGEIDGAEGGCITAVCQLYDSALAMAAWVGLERGIFQHVSAIVLHAPEDPIGGGTLLELGLTDYPGCPNARVLKTWES